MKRLILTALITALFIPLIFAQEGSNTLEVIVNGKAVEFDSAPYIQNGRTMVPMRAVLNAVGANIKWDGATKAATAQKDNTTVILIAGSDNAVVDTGGNPQNVLLEVPAEIKQDRMFVPLRFISESLGYNVVYDGKNHKIFIDTPNTTNLYLACKIVDDDKKWGYINDSGTFIIQPQYGYAYDFIGNYADVRDANSENSFVIDKNGSKVDIAPYSLEEPHKQYNDGLTIWNTNTEYYTLYGLNDKDGKVYFSFQNYKGLFRNIF